jgi:hypothetical protein
MVIGFLVFLLVPGTRTRYVYPLVPWCCLLAGRILDLASVESAERSALRRLRIPAYIAVALGALTALIPIYLHFHPVNGIDHLTPLGYAIVTAVLVATVIAIVRLRGQRSRLPLLAGFVILSLLRLLQITEVKPALALSRPRVEMARRLESLVPESETLHTNIWGQFNTLFYLRRTVLFVENPRSVEAGTLLLVNRKVKNRLEREPGFRIETLLETTMANGQQVALLRTR